MKKVKDLLRNRNFILILSLVTGLLWDQAVQWTQLLTLPALSLIMTVSVMGITGSEFRSPRALVLPALVGIFMNYLVLGGFILSLSAIVIRHRAIWEGFVILAAVPPGVAVIPFSHLIKGNTVYSLMGTVGAYLGALFLMPIMTLGLLGSSFVHPAKLLMIIFGLIVLPLVFSRILISTRANKRIESVRGAITNWGFFVVVYTIIALNRDIFVYQPLALVPVATVAFGSTFILGFLIQRVGFLLRIDHRISTSLVLLGTFKNAGLAGGIALALFGKQTAVPAMVAAVFMIVYIIWLGFQKG